MGLYPDLPGHRFAYDVDGTLVLSRQDTVAYAAVSTANLGILNNETSDQIVSGGVSWSNVWHWSFVFPEVRTLSGIFVRAINCGVPALHVSTDTTDGVNGTWTNIQNLTQPPQTVPDFRSAVVLVTGSAVNIKGARVMLASAIGSGQLALETVHMYGTKVGQGLEFWDPTLDQAAGAAVLDFAEVAQGSVTVKPFRLKNRHATQTANNVTLTRTTPTGTMGAGVDFSADGGTTWATTLDIGALAPGAVSGLLRARRTVPANETVRVQACRVSAIAGSWS